VPIVLLLTILITENELSPMNNINIILASQSPRRKQLLEQIGIFPDCQPVNIDETKHKSETPLQ